MDAVDALVRLGVFKSRSEALKTLIRIGLSSVGDAANIVKISERLFELEEHSATYLLGWTGALKILWI